MPEQNPTAPEKLSISRKVIIGATFTLVMLGMISVTSFMTTRRLVETAERVGEKRDVLLRSEQLLRHIIEMENAVRGFVISGNDEVLVPYTHGLSFILQDIVDLKRATHDDPDQQFRLARLQNRVTTAADFYADFIADRRISGIEVAAASYNAETATEKAKAIFTQISDDLVEFEQAERRILRNLEESRQDIASLNSSFVVAGTSLTYIALLLACLTILRDIRERRVTGEQLELERNLLRRVMDTIPDQIFVKDLDGRYIRSNTAHAQYVGRETAAQVEGLTDHDFYPPELVERYRADDLAVLSSRKAQLDKDEPSRDFSGHPVWLETSKVPLFSAAQRLIGLVGISSDITKRREDEEKLVHYADALRKSNEELQNFASVASHDLQEPLRKIQAFGDRLRSRCADKLDESGKDYLARMLNAAERMQRLIQDLLQLSRIVTRAQPFERCDLAEVVKGVLGDLEVRIASLNANVTVENLPFLDADPTQMRQLLQNLISNALKFQSPGVKPEVRVTGSVILNLHGELPTSAHASPLAEIRVEDNGIGFDQKFAEQIFGAFKRLHTREEFDGSGIGLSVCRKITDRHHGKIMAQSELGKGATFIVTLPIHQPQTST
jgi:two-component system, LuxR family, sensor kinase FixL